ncbi:MAG: hypothetical protein ABJ263_18075 [Tateyamaria sp.]|uniref:hypothetical protein n=1 Tax=Tateyamaria sp. TaxID=1929288 RepID=UPI00326DD406
MNATENSVTIEKGARRLGNVDRKERKVMVRKSLLVLPLVLSACSETIATQETTFNFQGESLRAEVRTYDQNGRVFERRVIYDGIRAVSCSATDDLDCESAINFSRYDTRGF